LATVKDLFKSQKEFNNLFYDLAQLSDNEKEEITKSLSLALHSEISSLISAINFKDHKHSRREIDKCKILFESVDAFRYILSILNIWEISSDEFLEAFDDKDVFLNLRHKHGKKKWDGRPVVIVDMDDVITDFRNNFSSWVENRYSIAIDVESPEYYFITDLAKHGINPEGVFLDFVAEGGFRSLSPVPGAREFLKGLRDSGCWIQLLTARPSDNIRCFYDTYGWLSDHDIVFDKVEFSPEKFRWCVTSEYYDSGSILFAIDDAPKHAEDYSQHGIKCFVPMKSYNRKIWGKDNITTFSKFDEILKIVESRQYNNHVRRNLNATE